MSYRVDVEREYQKAKSKLFISALIFSILLSLIIIFDALLIKFSDHEYIANLIIAIIVTCLFSCFAVFFFTNIYNEVSARYRYFRGYDIGLKPTEEVEFIKLGDEQKYVNGLYVYPVSVSYIENFEKKEKIFYSLTHELDYQSGDKLTVTTYQRIILKADKHSWTL